MNVQQLVTMTSSTCGAACWEAREEACHCSCGGRNHGILRQEGAARPERTRRIKGHWYRLAGMGDWTEIKKQAYDYNVPAGNYSNMKTGWHQAVTQLASPAQVKWPEVAAWMAAQPVYRRPELLWLPVEETK